MQNEKQFGKGALDKPTDWQKPGAPSHAEIAGAFAPAIWREKGPADWVTYPKRNQGVTLACSAYTMAKLLAIDELSENGFYRELSPHGLYSMIYAPGGGANSLLAAENSAKFGMTLEHLYQSDGLDESGMESSSGLGFDAKQVALIYKAGQIVECGADFETIASIIDGYRAQGKKKGVGVTVSGENNGTWLSAYPKPPASSASITWFHRVPVVDFGLVNGKKFLAIDNSWGAVPGAAGQQYLGEDYAPFIFGAAYTLNIPDDWQNMTAPPGPFKYTWNADLTLGATGHDVLALQKALQAMGMFPIASIVGPTGNFGGITQKAVILFQQAFGIPATGFVGPMTRAKLNELFS